MKYYNTNYYNITCKLHCIINDMSLHASTKCLTLLQLFEKKMYINTDQSVSVRFRPWPISTLARNIIIIILVVVTYTQHLAKGIYLFY